MKNLLLIFLSIWSFNAIAQQVADTTYNPKINAPAYTTGKGPVVFIDEGHHNFHTKDGRYKTFSNLLERDGYIVKAFNGQFTIPELSQGKILVISNALNEVNVGNWSLPTPSAFSNAEIEAVENWVNEGGSLFLIADHMPMAGAAEDMAKVFGFEFTNGFVFDTLKQGPAFFNLKDNTLKKSNLTKGRNANERVEQIATFTGQAFKIPEDATPILIFSDKYINLLPERAWVFDETTTVYNVGGWSQGAFKTHGKGKVVVFGEAAMFSAQLAGTQQVKVGMNSELAAENHQLLLNIIHWLDDLIN